MVFISDIKTIGQSQKVLSEFSKQLSALYTPQLINQLNSFNDSIAASMHALADTVTPLDFSNQIALSTARITEQLASNMQKQLLNSFGYTHLENYSVIQEQYKALTSLISLRE